MKLRRDCRAAFVLLLTVAPLACGGSGGGSSNGSGSAGSAGSGVVGGSASGGTSSTTSGTGGSPDSVNGGAAGSGGAANVGGGGASAAAGGGGVAPVGGGAAVPFTTYEAEDLETTGSVLGPSRTWGEVASEASGRKAVRLSAAGQYVQLKTGAASNSVVVRYSVPDGTSAATLTLAIGGAEKKLSVTSRYSWSYGDLYNQPAQNDPSQGKPHHFFDEARLLIPEGIPAGTVVQLKKSADDTAATYDIDLVELEQVAPALAMPAGFKSVVDCGANGSDDKDDSAAFQACIDMPHGDGLYIPPGKFIFDASAVNVAGVTIRGAGMWHSTIGGAKAHFVCTGDNCKYYDFAVFGETTARDDGAAGRDDAAFDGPQNSGTVLDHIWVEHRRVGFWSGLYPDSGDDKVSIKNCRFRNLHADGVNFYGGITNSVVENCHFRNTGDDSIASWSHGGDGANGHPANANNAFRHNTIQSTWMASCFGIYGGHDNVIEDNVCADDVQLAGILVAQSFDSHPFGGTTTFARNTLLRDGGNWRNSKQGALKLEPQQGNISGVRFTELSLVDSTYCGVLVVGGDNGGNQVDGLSLESSSIKGSGEFAIFLPVAAHGSMTLTDVTVSGGTGALFDDPGNQFNVVMGAGNVGF